MDQRLSLSIAEAARACGIGRTSLYNAISNGDLRVIKHGRRTLVPVDELKNWLARLPAPNQ